MTRMNMQVKVPQYTAISGKVVGKSSRDIPDRYCGWFEFTVLQRNLKE